MGGGVVIISAILTYSCEYLTTPPLGDENLGLQCFPFAILSMPFWFTRLTLLPNTVYLFVVVLMWSIISALIGGLVGYIKNNKKSSR